MFWGVRMKNMEIKTGKNEKNEKTEKRIENLMPVEEIERPIRSGEVQKLVENLLASDEVQVARAKGELIGDKRKVTRVVPHLVKIYTYESDRRAKALLELCSFVNLPWEIVEGFRERQWKINSPIRPIRLTDSEKKYIMERFSQKNGDSPNNDNEVIE